jgi:hypothetical protein
MSTVFLHPTRKTYYRRVQIPQKIRKHFNGRVEVWRSLKTADKDPAIIPYRVQGVVHRGLLRWKICFCRRVVGASRVIAIGSRCSQIWGPSE